MNFASKTSFKMIILTILLWMVIVGSPFQNVQAQAFDLDTIQRATVFIMQTQTLANDQIITCVGSGTIVSNDGLILTNAHNTLTSENCPGDTLVVGLSVRQDEPPVPQYIAEIIQANAGLDIALLRITRQNDGRQIDSNTLNLPFVQLGDSSAVDLDATLTVVGFSGIGNDAIQVSRGTVIGFSAEPSGGDKSWIKTSANITGTMTGGGVYNQAGLLIGIPTSAPVSRASSTSNCLTIQDTNSDGAINNNDSCVPIGATINSIRPISFASPLLRAASLGISVSMPNDFTTNTRARGNPTLRYLGFSPSINEAGMPTTIIRSLPTGSTGLYLFFDYNNMTPETVYELRVTTDGVLNPTFSLSPVRWSGGVSGLWYVGSRGQPWPNGRYDFTLLINGNVAGNARLVVGENTTGAPEFSEAVFGSLDSNGNLSGTGYVLPTGTTASGMFLYRNMPTDISWDYIWYYQGSEIQRSPAGNTWLESDGATGRKAISIQDPNGLLPGTYRLELYIDGRLSLVSDFTIAGAQEGAFSRIFENVHLTTAQTVSEALVASPITSFSRTTTTIYSLFDWEQISPGTLWTARWYVDNELFFDQTMPWSGPNTGDNFLIQLHNPQNIPDGRYRLDLLLGGLQFGTAEARVGIGQLSLDFFAETGGYPMRGRILDADTGQGIAGVTVFVVSDLFSAADFLTSWDQTQIYGTGITDRAGEFQVDSPLFRDVLYSIVIVADGYLPVTADGVELNEETHPNEDPVQIELYLTRG